MGTERKKTQKDQPSSSWLIRSASAPLQEIFRCLLKAGRTEELFPLKEKSPSNRWHRHFHAAFATKRPVAFLRSIRLAGDFFGG